MPLLMRGASTREETAVRRLRRKEWTNLETTHGIQGAKIALLIDFDNVILGVEDPGFDVELVVNALRARGIVVMGRAYGDWYRHHRHRRKLMEQGIELVETPVFGPVIKNSADIRIVLDGIDVALAHSHIDTFCLVSGDSDFLPLIKRLQLLGKNVIVIAGQKFTSELVRRNCNEYIAYENLLAESIGATEDVSTLDGACQLLQRAINTLLERGMDARSSTVKQMMLQMNPAFSERTFGCNQFKQFLDKATRTGAVKLGDRDTHSGEYAVLLTESAEITRIETSEKVLQRDDSNSRRRDRDRERRRENTETAKREALNGVASTREPHSDAPQVESASEIPLAIEDEMLAESGTTLGASNDKLQTRGALRRGRLKFSAKAGVSAVTENAPPVAAEQRETPDATSSETQNTATEGSIPGSTSEGGNAPDIEMSQEAVGSASALEVESSAESVETTTTPKRRTTRGGRRRKPKTEASEGAESAAAEPSGVAATSETQAELDGAVTSVEDLQTITPQAVESAETPAAIGNEAVEAAPVTGAADSAVAPDASVEASESGEAAPKRRAPRGGRRKRPAASKEE